MSKLLKFTYSTELAPVRDKIIKQGWKILDRGCQLAEACWNAQDEKQALDAMIDVLKESESLLQRYPADAVLAALEPAFFAACDAMQAIEQVRPDLRDTLHDAALELGVRRDQLRIQAFGNAKEGGSLS